MIGFLKYVAAKLVRWLRSLKRISQTSPTSTDELRLRKQEVTQLLSQLDMVPPVLDQQTALGLPSTVEELRSRIEYLIASGQPIEPIYLLKLGVVEVTLGRYDQAELYFQMGAQAANKAGDKATYASGIANIGLVYQAKGDLGEALKYLRDALVIHREVDYRLGEANQLGNIGLIYFDKGDLDAALKHHRDALAINRELGYRQGEASNLGNIGNVYIQKGNLDEALKHHENALEIDREIGYRQGEADDFGNIGLIYQDKGDLDAALKYYKGAMEIDREIGYRQGEANQLGNIGLIYSDKGELDEALVHLRQALELFEDIGMPLQVEQTKRNIAEIEAEQKGGDSNK